MKRNVFQDGNGSGLVMIEGLGEFVPVAQLAELEQCIADQKRLTKELDIILNGENAAEQASLCDLVAQVRSSKSRTHIISPQVFEDTLKERDELKARSHLAEQEVSQLKARTTELYMLLDEHFTEWEQDSGEWDEAEWHDRVSVALAKHGHVLADHNAKVIKAFIAGRLSEWPSTLANQLAAEANDYTDKLGQQTKEAQS